MRRLMLAAVCLMLLTLPGLALDPITYVSSLNGTGAIEVMDSYYDAGSDETLVYAVNDDNEIDVFVFRAVNSTRLGTFDPPGGVGTIWDIRVDQRTFGTGAGDILYIGASGGLYAYDFSNSITNPTLRGSYTTGSYFNLDVAEYTDMTGFHYRVFGATPWTVQYFDADTGLSWSRGYDVVNSGMVHDPGSIAAVVGEEDDCWYVWKEAFMQDPQDPITEPGCDVDVNELIGWETATISHNDYTTYWDNNAIYGTDEAYAVEGLMNSANPTMWTHANEDVGWNGYFGISKIYDDNGITHSYCANYNLNPLISGSQFYPVDHPNLRDFLLVSDGSGFGLMEIPDENGPWMAERRDYVYLNAEPVDLRSEVEDGEAMAYVAVGNTIHRYRLNDAVAANQPNILRFVFRKDSGAMIEPAWIYVHGDTYQEDFGMWAAVSRWNVGTDILVGGWDHDHIPEFFWHEVEAGFNYVETVMTPLRNQQTFFAIALEEDTTIPLGHDLEWTSVSLYTGSTQIDGVEWAETNNTTVYSLQDDLVPNKPWVNERSYTCNSMGTYTMIQYLSDIFQQTVVYDKIDYTVSRLAADDGGEPVSAAQPDICSLSAAPNPFNPTTTVQLVLPDAGNVEVAVYDVLGRQVAELLSGHKDAGRHQVSFDGRALASGVYFVRADVDGEGVLTEKLMLLR